MSTELHNAGALDNDPKGINNLSSAADHGRLVVERKFHTGKIAYSTSNVTVYYRDKPNAHLTNIDHWV